MYINLKDGDLHSKNFYIDANGNAFFKGDITGAFGTFKGGLEAGNFIVNSNGINFANRFTVDNKGRAVFNISNESPGWQGICWTDPDEMVKEVRVPPEFPYIGRE